jgi:chemotaxis-related protein WspB
LIFAGAAAMLFLLFQIGSERYALRASRVVKVLPLVAMKRLPQAPKGVAGILNYRGQPVPAVDLSELTSGTPASERLSTRIIIVHYSGPLGQNHLLGLVAENATEIIHRDPEEFADSGLKVRAAPYLGPVLMDTRGSVQLLHEQRLLPPAMRELLFSERALEV